MRELNGKFILHVIIAFAIMNLTLDLVDAFIAPGVKTIVYNPFNWLKAKFLNPVTTGS